MARIAWNIQRNRKDETEIARLVEPVRQRRVIIIGESAMTIVLVSLLITTALLGAWTLAILKVKRQLEDAAAIRRRLARGHVVIP
jgi:hypothetical protein